MIRSLQRRLTVLTLCCIGLVTIPLFVFSYANSVDEMNELSDARLAQSAKTLEALSAHVTHGDSFSPEPVIIQNSNRPKGAGKGQGYEAEAEVGFQYWATPTQLRLTTEELGNLSFDAAPIGFADIIKDKRRWRIYTKIGASSGFVRAAERFDSRREIKRDLLIQNAVPLLFGLPLLALLVSLAVQRGLRPLRDVTTRLENRSTEDVGPMDGQDAPQELVPVIGALNGLLRRLRRVLDNERQFTANAAHELRTPLAGALVHLGNAEAGKTDTERAIALADIRGSLERMRHIVSQMIELARWESAAAMNAFDQVDLAACIGGEVEALATRAAAKDIGIIRRIADEARTIRGWEPGIRILLRNLLDNAISYGLAGGHVRIQTELRGNRTLLIITDNGPGIAPSQRDAMLERFQRGPQPGNEGSGLGLAIAARIAQLHGASLKLFDAGLQSGLRVEVLFP